MSNDNLEYEIRIYDIDEKKIKKILKKKHKKYQLYQIYIKN